MEQSPKKVMFVNESPTRVHDSNHSPVSTIIAFLLGITLFVFIQYLISDLTAVFFETEPGVRINSLTQMTQKMIVSSFINVPAFVLSLLLLFGLAVRKEAWKLPAMTYFLAMSGSMLIMLVQLVTLSYELNQKLTVYAVSIVLIILFTASVVMIQEKYLKNKKSGLS